MSSCQGHRLIRALWVRARGLDHSGNGLRGWGLAVASLAAFLLL